MEYCWHEDCVGAMVTWHIVCNDLGAMENKTTKNKKGAKAPFSLPPPLLVNINGTTFRVVKRLQAVTDDLINNFNEKSYKSKVNQFLQVHHGIFRRLPKQDQASSSEEQSLYRLFLFHFWKRYKS